MVSVELYQWYFYLGHTFFMHHAEDFHHLLDFHQSIISGSVALALFAWMDKWEPGNMDIYVPDNSYPHFIGNIDCSLLVTLEVDMGPCQPSSYHRIKHVCQYITPNGQSTP